MREWSPTGDGSRRSPASGTVPRVLRATHYSLMQETHINTPGTDGLPNGPIMPSTLEGIDSPMMPPGVSTAPPKMV